VARVELAAAAVEDLRTLIRTHSLARDTGARVVLGPWRWMLLVYVVLEPGDRVVVVTVQDARSSTAVTDSRQ
jgi:hypothetical protein